MNPTARLFAIESSEAACVAIAEKLPEVRIVADDAAGLGEVEERFAVVTVLQVLEHVADPAGLARAIHERLEDGGALLVTVPNLRSYRVRLNGLGDPLCFEPTHLQFFSAATLSRLLREAGFVRVERLIEFGGSNVRSLPGRMAQWALRRLGVSSEIRMLAWR